MNLQRAMTKRFCANTRPVGLPTPERGNQGISPHPNLLPPGEGTVLTLPPSAFGRKERGRTRIMPSPRAGQEGGNKGTIRARRSQGTRVNKGTLPSPLSLGKHGDQGMSPSPLSRGEGWGEGYEKPLSLAGNQQGMTLIELTVVLLILISLATIAIRSTAGLQDQARWEQTKNRYAEIKKAIIGDPKLIINGQPDISGFVADMGRLPACIQELLAEGYCPKNTFCDQTACNTDTPDSWVASGYNWKGPYLISSELATDADAFSDGWGRTAAGNYGWSITFDTINTASATTMTIQSLGKDQTAGGTSPYDSDYPATTPSINKNDWQIDISGGVSVMVNTLSNGECGEATCSKPSLEDSVSCTSEGATWNPPPCSDPTHTDKTACEDASETWTPSPAGEANCKAATKLWNPIQQDICLHIEYRGINNTTGATEIKTAISDTFPITEDGNQHIALFSGFKVDDNGNEITDAGETTINDLPIGNITFAVKKDCTTAPLDYGNSTNPVPVTVFPHKPLPTINW